MGGHRLPPWRARRCGVKQEAADDVRAALAFIACHAKALRIDSERLVVLGEDVGAQLAVTRRSQWRRARGRAGRRRVCRRAAAARRADAGRPRRRRHRGAGRAGRASSAIAIVALGRRLRARCRRRRDSSRRELAAVAVALQAAAGRVAAAGARRGRRAAAHLRAAAGARRVRARPAQAPDLQRASGPHVRRLDPGRRRTARARVARPWRRMGSRRSGHLHHADVPSAGRGRPGLVLDGLRADARRHARPAAAGPAQRHRVSPRAGRQLQHRHAQAGDCRRVGQRRDGGEELAPRTRRWRVSSRSTASTISFRWPPTSRRARP